MAREYDKKVSELFHDIPLQVELEPSSEFVTEEMKDLMEEVKRFDAPYSLKLNDHRNYVLFSIVALARGDPYEAEEWAKKSLKVEKSCEGLMARGNALFKQGDHKGALGSYDEALEYCGDKAKVHRHRYLALKRRGMNKRALDALEDAFREKRDHELMGEYADTLVDVGEIDKAKKYYGRLEEITGTDSRRKEKARELLKKAKSQSLPDEFHNVLKLDRGCKDAWIGKAEGHWSLGQNEEAITCLKSARKYFEKGAVDELLREYLGTIPTLKECPVCNGTGQCVNCEGSGGCEKCKGSGDCVKCGGTGECRRCKGNLECPDCQGQGKTNWIFKCKSCGGTGRCPECDELGICSECDHLGDCTLCGGTGNCGDCNGSGSCSRCEGKGEIMGYGR